MRLLRGAAPDLRIAVDTSDAPLAELAAGLPDSAPDLVKPNGEELGQLVGLPADRAMALEEGAVRGELAPVADAARVLVDLGIGAVMATLGPAGAVLVTDGDAAERLRTAMIYGSAAASLPGTTLPSPSDLPAQGPVVTRLV